MMTIKRKLVIAMLFSMLIVIGLLPQAAVFAAENDASSTKTIAEEDTMPVGGWAPAELHEVTEDVDAENASDMPAKKRNVINAMGDSVFTKGASTVGYDSLSTKGQRFYNKMNEEALAFMNAASDLKPTSMNSEPVYVVATLNYGEMGITNINDAWKAFYAYDYDHPGYYWISNSVWYNTYSQSLYLCTEPEYAKVSERAKINKLVEDGVKEYAALAENGTDDLDKIAILHDKIVREVDYAYYTGTSTPVSEKWAHSVHGIFDPQYKEVVCEGYADGFSLILNYMDLPNYYIVGTARGGSGNTGGHAWNAASADKGKTYFYMDLTWDDDGDGEYIYEFFGLPKSLFETRHFKYGPNNSGGRWLYPISDNLNNSFEGTYYNLGGFYYDGSREDAPAFAARVRTKAARVGNCLSIECPDTTALCAAASALGEDEPSYYSVTINGNTYYVFKKKLANAEINLSAATLTPDQETYFYTGSAVEPKPVVTCNGSTLIEGADYTLSYENNTDIGNSAKVTVTGTGNFTGSATMTFAIVDRTQATYTVTFDKNDSRATGTMGTQKYTYNTAQKLTKNGFAKPCYNFVEWNTKADGTGTSYPDQDSITVSANMTLYAQWAEGTHNWSFKDFTWTGNTSGGYTAASANYACLNDSTHTKAVQATITSKVTEPTCTATGKTTYTASVTASASPDNAVHTESKDAKTTQATGHNVSGTPWQHNDDQHWHVCTACKQEVDKSAHSWDAGVVTTEPTTEQAGEKTYTCTVCLATKKETLDPQSSEPGESGGGDAGGGTPAGGGSGGGDAGGGDPMDEPPAEPEPVIVSDPKSPVDVTVTIQDNTATVAPISKEDLAEVSAGDVISMDVSGMTEKEVTSLCISTDTMKNIAESPAKGVEVKLDTATVNLDQMMMESLAQQAKGNEIKLQIDSGTKAEATLNMDQKETIAEMNGSVVVEANLTSGAEKISQFNGGIMTLSIQYVTNDSVRGWFLPDSGSKESVSCSYTDHVATLSLNHCSHYAVEGYVPVENQLTVKACTSKKKPVAVKAKKVKKAARQISTKKYVSVKNPNGEVSYEKISGKAAFSVNAENGSIIVKKGTKKGTYKLKIKVTAAGDNTYKAGSKNVTCYVKVK